MKKKIWIPIIAVAVLFSTVSFTTSYKNDFFEIAKQIEIFTTLFKELNMNYVDETTPATLMDKAITGMLEDLDPYTVYWTEQEVEDSRINNSGVYTGIGAAIKTKKDKLLVIEPFEGYPADKAGLKAYRLFEANTPVDVWFLRPAYNYLIGYQIKEMIDPGYFDRLQGYTKQNTGQEFFLKP